MRELFRRIFIRIFNVQQRALIKAFLARSQTSLLKKMGYYDKFAHYETQIQMLQAQVKNLEGLARPPRFLEAGEKKKFQLIKG